ncbi:hypothetical protein ACFCP7_15435 [Paenibacillus elgii]
MFHVLGQYGILSSGQSLAEEDFDPEVANALLRMIIRQGKLPAAKPQNGGQVQLACPR